MLPDGREFVERGVVEGLIGYEQKGENGFGYDKIFVPENMDKTLAEIAPEEKNKFSHRKRALEDLKNILGDKYDNSSC